MESDPSKRHMQARSPLFFQYGVLPVETDLFCFVSGILWRRNYIGVAPDLRDISSCKGNIEYVKK